MGDFTPRACLRKGKETCRRHKIPGLCMLIIKRNCPIHYLIIYPSSFTALKIQGSPQLFHTNIINPQHFSRKAKSQKWNQTTKEWAAQGGSSLESGVSHNSQAMPGSYQGGQVIFNDQEKLSVLDLMIHGAVQYLLPTCCGIHTPKEVCQLLSHAAPKDWLPPIQTYTMPSPVQSWPKVKVISQELSKIKTFPVINKTLFPNPGYQDHAWKPSNFPAHAFSLLISKHLPHNLQRDREAKLLAT